MSCLQGNKYVLAITLLSFAVVVPTAQATILTEGQSGIPSALVPGWSLQAAMTGNISEAAFATTFAESVHADPGNSFCVNCLAFLYQFTKDAPGVNAGYPTSPFADFQTDVGDNPASAPATNPIRSIKAQAMPTPDSAMPAITKILPGETNARLAIEIETVAKKYGAGHITVRDGTP